MTRYAKIKIISLLALGLALLTSCQSNTPTKETEIPTEKSITHTTSENTLGTQSLPDGVVEYSIGLAYQSDVEKYGVISATSFYEWRQTGNPDWRSSNIQSAYVAYHGNEGGIVFEPLQKTYSAKDRDATWGIDALSVSNDILVLACSDELNIERKLDGQWVRLALLDPDRVLEPGIIPIGNRNKKIVDTVFTISLDEAAFEIEPGEYRFIFYAYVSANKKIENRMYYIPFEVIE